MHNINWVVAAPAGLFLIALIGGGFAIAKTIFYMGKMHEQMISLQNEFKPNGGKSMKDDMNNVKGDIRDINTRLADHLVQHSGQWR
jgi:hypothetical protein